MYISPPSLSSLIAYVYHNSYMWFTFILFGYLFFNYNCLYNRIKHMRGKGGGSYNLTLPFLNGGLGTIVTNVI